MTLRDRIATAGVSFVAALITAFVVIAVAVGRGGDMADILASAPWAVAFSGVAAVVAFIVGPDRAAAWLGVIWETEDPGQHRGFIAVIALAIIAACLWSLLR